MGKLLLLISATLLFVSNGYAESVINRGDTADNITIPNETNAKSVEQDNSKDSINPDTTKRKTGADESEPYNKYVALNLSYYTPSGGKDILKANFSLGFNFGYLFFEYLGIEVGASSQTKSRVTKYDIKAYLTSQYQFAEINKFPVYVYGGAGVVYSNLDLVASSNKVSGSKQSINFGGKLGVKIIIAGRYNLGVAAEYIGAEFISENFSAVTIGGEAGILF